MDLPVPHPRIPQMSFQDRSQRSLLFHIPKILQHPPCTTTTRITSGAPLTIMEISHGAFTEMIAAINGKISKARNHLLIFFNPATNEIMYCSYSMTTSEESTEEEEKDGYNSQETNIMSPNFSEMTGMNHQESLFFPTGTFFYFMMLAWT